MKSTEIGTGEVTMSTPYELAKLLIEQEWRGSQDSTGVPYMWHIELGCRVLEELNADQDTMAAFCLHPLLQGDQAIKKWLPLLLRHPHLSTAICYALEYRHMAERYGRWVDNPPPINIATKTITPVVKMLIADKLTNMWNLTRNRREHPQYQFLVDYFKWWLLKALEVSPEAYARWMDKLDRVGEVYGFIGKSQ